MFSAEIAAELGISLETAPAPVSALAPAPPVAEFSDEDLIAANNFDAGVWVESTEGEYSCLLPVVHPIAALLV